MLNGLSKQDINAEIIVTFLFMILSFIYLELRFGSEKLIDSVFLWMFPASIMIFLTLLLVKVIERFHDRRVKGYRYVDWRRN
jgi:hypothetical protein